MLTAAKLSLRSIGAKAADEYDGPRVAWDAKAGHHICTVASFAEVFYRQRYFMDWNCVPAANAPSD